MIGRVERACSARETRDHSMALDTDPPALSPSPSWNHGTTMSTVDLRGYARHGCAVEVPGAPTEELPPEPGRTVLG